ncbi:MAG: DUF58 domain-containing protein [Spongiibacteraceae bacterium]|jgi:uncharacterized protein (DUF58 family)|nr:DUF58 domain-containing protein [Spongiibacteraceae bacterium]
MAAELLHAPLRGAYCDLSELTAARFAAQHLQWRQLRRARALQSGMRRSALRGRGLEFEEVRAYQAGDDVRTIDWRVTARSGRAFTKLFREERERPLLLAVDQRQPMYFGSRYCLKAKLAAWLGAVLAWRGIDEGDRVGGLVFGNDARRDIRPRRNRRTVLAWLQALHEFNHRLDHHTLLDDAAGSLQAALTNLERIARPGSSVVLISDLSGADQLPLAERLSRIARHCETTVILVADPLEQELPPPGQYGVTDGRQRLLIDTGDAELRARFAAAAEARHRALRQTLASIGVPLLSAATSLPPLAGLTQPRVHA